MAHQDNVAALVDGRLHRRDVEVGVARADHDGLSAWWRGLGVWWGRLSSWRGEPIVTATTGSYQKCECQEYTIERYG